MKISRIVSFFILVAVLVMAVTPLFAQDLMDLDMDGYCEGVYSTLGADNVEAFLDANGNWWCREHGTNRLLGRINLNAVCANRTDGYVYLTQHPTSTAPDGYRLQCTTDASRAIAPIVPPSASGAPDTSTTLVWPICGESQVMIMADFDKDNTIGVGESACIDEAVIASIFESTQ